MVLGLSIVGLLAIVGIQAKKNPNQHPKVIYQLKIPLIIRVALGVMLTAHLVVYNIYIVCKNCIVKTASIIVCKICTGDALTNTAKHIVPMQKLHRWYAKFA